MGWGVREVQKGKRAFLLSWGESCVSGCGKQKRSLGNICDDPAVPPPQMESQQWDIFTPVVSPEVPPSAVPTLTLGRMKMPYLDLCKAVLKV